MNSKISRRWFLMTSATTIGSVIVSNFSLAYSALKATAAKSTSVATKETTMPHVIVKLYPGRSEQQKVNLAEAIVSDVVEILGSEEDSISVAIEEIEPGDWREKVYKPEILDKQETLYKKPGYSM